jgi:hypothetical protein
MRTLTHGRDGRHHAFHPHPFHEAFSLIATMLLAVGMVLLLVSSAR